MKISIVGAGPAGLSCALNASRDGHEACVFERDKLLGSKVCGEALARETLEHIDIKPSKKFIVSEVKGFKISFKGAFIKEARFGNLGNAPGYLIDKQSFLRALLDEAERADAKIRFDSRVEQVDPSSGKIRVQGGEIIKADLIVCADGSASLARSHLDYSGYDTAIGVQYRCAPPAGLDPDYLYLDIFGAGYIWTFIKKDCANIGLGLPKDSSSFRFLKTTLDRHLENLGVKPLGKVQSASISIGGPLTSFGTGKMVVAGEAAGCVMPLSGEGNRFAVYGGCIAYKPDYRPEFMKKYGKNMERSRKVLSLVKRLSDDERITFLNCLDNPLEVLEGKRPKMKGFIPRPKLLIKLIQSYV